MPGSRMTTVTCPVCGQDIKQGTRHRIALPHCDTQGHTCPMSGKPLAATTPKQPR